MTNRLPKHTPIHSIAESWGATFSDQAGWRIARSLGNLDDALQAAREGLALIDRSARGKILVEGATALEGLTRVWDVTEVKVNHGAPIPHGFLYRLRSDRYFLSVSPDAVEETVAAVNNTVHHGEQFITVTDVTHGRAELWLVGPDAGELLSRLCGLDFHPGAFASGEARESSVAKTKQLLVRNDVGQVPAFIVIGARSLGAYLWETILDAGRDLQLVPAGSEVMERLEGSG